MGVTHDFRCPSCGFVLRNAPAPAPFSRPDLNPRCPQHLWPLGGVLMDWLPAARFSGFSDAESRGGRSDFTKFTLPVEDPGSPTGYRDVTIGSLSDIRRLERESEQRERNGEGRRMVWRDYSQDASNAHTHTLMADPSVPLPRKTQQGARITARRGAPIVAEHGPADSV